MNKRRDLEVNTIHLGNCLELMQYIPDSSVDFIVCDLPQLYQITNCRWDQLIPFDKLWEQYKRIIKENAAICLFGCQPFTSSLVMSNLKWFRYTLVWNKERGSNFQHANKMPMKSHEDIVVFYKKLPTYNPQKTKGKPYHVKSGIRKYGVQATIDFEVFEVDGVDLRVDWTPAQADCEIMKDGGASTLCDNTATDEGSTYSVVLTATEMEFARGVLKVVDAAAKVFLDAVTRVDKAFSRFHSPVCSIAIDVHKEDAKHHHQQLAITRRQGQQSRLSF